MHANWDLDFGIKCIEQFFIVATVHKSY